MGPSFWAIDVVLLSSSGGFCVGVAWVFPGKLSNNSRILARILFLVRLSVSALVSFGHLVDPNIYLPTLPAAASMGIYAARGIARRYR